MCQTKITERLKPSNASAIIVYLWCRKFLQNKFAVGSCNSDLEKFNRKLQTTIFTGNFLNDSLQLPPGQPNLEVCDVINKINDLNLAILKDLGFFTVDEMKETFINLLQEGKRHMQVSLFFHQVIERQFFFIMKKK